VWFERLRVRPWHDIVNGYGELVTVTPPIVPVHWREQARRVHHAAIANGYSDTVLPGEGEFAPGEWRLVKVREARESMVQCVQRRLRQR
jgi:hypothetical protein